MDPEDVDGQAIVDARCCRSGHQRHGIGVASSQTSYEPAQGRWSGMSRTGVRVRPAETDDVPQLVALWEALQVSARDPLLPRARGVDAPGDVARRRLAALLGNPLARVVVAEDRSGQIVGMALLAAEQFGEFFE